jgi:cytochrome c oxidase subunit 2
MSLHTAVVPPRGVWWKPSGKTEKTWIIIAFIWCMVLFAMMPFWHIKGGQNPSGIRTRVESKAFAQRVKRFIDDYRVGEDGGLPVVKPPPGSDVYLQATMWKWQPVLILEEGVSYTLHISSLDVNHGFSLYPANVNFQIVPGYDYGLRITPNNPGEYKIICNEFCGINHHLMLGKVVIEPRGATAIAAAGGAG